MVKDIGSKIKELRLNKKLTLRDLAEKTGLSSGFLSQLERGLTTVAVDSLYAISKVLEVDLSYFFTARKNSRECVVCSYEHTVSRIESNKFIHFHLSNDLEHKQMFPEIVTLIPNYDEEDVEEFQHEGEEFIYVLEGMLTLYMNHQVHKLHPGDSIHFNSNQIHNWCNHTNRITRILLVRTPNPFKVSNDSSLPSDEKL